MRLYRKVFTATIYSSYIVFFDFAGAQRQGSAGPWHKVFAGWRRSKYFMPWSRMYPLVGQII
ncbi:MAG: hypothetical protein ACK5PQ_00065 [Alphaproteobacteria bacterium]